MLRELAPRLVTSMIVTLGAVAIGAVLGIILGIISAIKNTPGQIPGTDNFHVLSIGAGVCSGISSNPDIFSTASFTSGNRS